MKQKLVLLATMIIAAALSACHPQQKQEYAGVEGDTVNAVPLPERQAGTSFFGSNVSRSQFQPIYFAFDSSEIQSSEAGKLRQIADFMRRAPNNVILAGFTDERGTEEYNRALGERRAQATRSYLISLGVSGSRIQTVSFGMEMPADPDHNEAAWARNRRTEIGVVKQGR
ncbi:MAG: OmpA family protein [Verrucomicrobia bacterium]|nr:OmpA family protein [Verrucomicrobiota bacterium]